MPEFLTRQKTAEIINAAPPEVDRAMLFNDLAKQYEIEGYNAGFNPVEMVQNVPSSLKEFGSAIWTAISKPGQTVKALGTVARGGFRKAVEAVTGEELPEAQEDITVDVIGTQQDEVAFDRMVDFFVDRYGSTDRLLNTIEKDPAGFLSDASVVLGGAGAVAKTAGLGARIPIAGRTLAGVGEAGAKVQRFSRVLEPTTAAITGARRLNKIMGIDKFIVTPVTRRFMKKAIGLGVAEREIGQAARLPLTDSPLDFLNRHGISGGLEDIHRQLDNVAQKSSQKLDQLLVGVETTFKSDAARGLISELKSRFTKSGEDVVTGFDVVTKGGKTQLIPFEAKQPIDIPRENLPQSMLDELNQIRQWEQQLRTEGLTLTELNAIKRMADRKLSIFDRSGEVKALKKAEELSEHRKDLRRFIENEAANAGIPDVRQLNQQQQISRLLRDHLESTIRNTEVRSAIGDQIIFLMGLTGSAASGNLGFLLGAGAIVGSREIARLPKVRTFMATKLRLMSDGDYQALLRGVQTGKVSKRAFQTMRRLRKDLQKAFPEIRFGGLAVQQQDQQRIPVRGGTLAAPPAVSP